MKWVQAKICKTPLMTNPINFGCDDPFICINKKDDDHLLINVL